MRELIESFLEEGVFLSPEVLDKKEKLIQDKGRIMAEKPLLFEAAPAMQKPPVMPSEGGASVEVIEQFDEKNIKIKVEDFVSMYNSRYGLLQSILRQRQELQVATSIRKINAAPEKEKVSFIGMLLESSLTKNDNYIFSFEDFSGVTKAIATKNKRELYETAKGLAQDSVVGVQGTKGRGIIFVDNLILPDIPLSKEMKKAPNKESAVFISDLHFGAKAFLKDSADKFIQWINGKMGSEEQRNMVRKIKYLFIVGDLVEGIGIFPGQEDELQIKDIYEQYAAFGEFLKKIPEEIHVIICPGNHDSLRIAEPQPPLTKELIESFENRKNTYFTSSPSLVRVGALDSFPGFDVLLYHGFSFPYYADFVEEIRLSGGLENTGQIMKYLLQFRHLAPTHGSTQYQLGYEGDPLVLRQVPDFFVTGHVHRASVDSYRNVTLLNCSCWVSQTDYQEKHGLVPQPARAIYVDLNTRKTKILNFA